MIPKKINNENKYKIGSKRAEDHDRMDDRSISPLSDSLRSLNDNFPGSPDQKSRLIKERKSYIPTIRKPDIVSQTSSGSSNVISVIDPRSWLEVLDTKHRYSKHLRIYHRAWSELGEPNGDFFHWLEHTNHEVMDYPRTMLDNDVVHYCSEEEVLMYSIRIDKKTGLFYSVNTGELVQTGQDGWIFVLNKGIISAAPKKTTSPRFHHSSFYGGGCVEVAGIIVVGNGKLERLYPHSGHYRPTEQHVKHFLQYLASHGVDLESFEVDVQHMMKISRPYAMDGTRVKKRECPYYMTGIDVLNFLNVKVESESLLQTISQRKAAVLENDDIQYREEKNEDDGKRLNKGQVKKEVNDDQLGTFNDAGGGGGGGGG